MFFFSIISFSRQWSGDENRHASDEASRRRDTEHPLIEASIPLVRHSLSQQESNPVIGTNPHTESQSYRTRDNNVSQTQQESVLQKFRKSFSLRFHKRGSKEGSTEIDGQSTAPLPPPLPPDNDGDSTSTLRLSADDDRESPSQNMAPEQHKEDISDQKFR